MVASERGGACWSDSKAEIRAVASGAPAMPLAGTLPSYDLVLADRRVAMVIHAGEDGTPRAYTVVEPVVAILGSIWDSLWAARCRWHRRCAWTSWRATT